ncbi:hypothetical protein ACOQFO_02150 [Ureibacillus sp. MALMAid1270]|uniref:hypothetical protein n=1 Tax=Ureibacillus sp. MALMAid1270 TaxID=3411629 RepID=UPI003BA6D965
MKHIVFLLSNYKPNITATSNCAFNVIQSLKGNYEVSVICLHYGEEKIIKESMDGVNVIRIRDNYAYILNLLKGKYLSSESSYTKVLFGVIFKLFRILNYLVFLIKPTSIRRSIINKFYENTKAINFEKKVSAIIPVSLGYESVVAGYKLKLDQKETVFIPYLFDPFTQNIALHKGSFVTKIRKKRHLALEKKVIEASDKVFILPQLEEIFSQPPFSEHKSKIVLTEHPLLGKVDNKNLSQVFSRNNKIKIVYTGALYQKIRNPEYFLNTFKISGINKISELHMYTTGDCDSILNKFIPSLKNTLILHGRVAFEEAQSAMYNADILINLGNSVSYQIPSKIFEYIATGKPIVHIYSLDDDKVIDILKDYPLALCLKCDIEQMEENSQKLFNFCTSNLGRSIEYEEIKELYSAALPETTSNLFSKYIHK